jgi:hypothetical protein
MAFKHGISKGQDQAVVGQIYPFTSFVKQFCDGLIFDNDVHSVIFSLNGVFTPISICLFFVFVFP